MRHYVLAAILCSTSACPSDEDDTVGDGTATGGTDATDGSTATVGSNSASQTTDPTDPTDPSGAPETTAAETSPTSADGSSDGGESSTGEMSGCEGGPLPAPIPGCTPTPPALTGDFGQDCVDRINQFRWECQCLPPLARWADAEMCTDTQSGNDQNGGGPHANFGACGESAQNTCPDWPSESDVIVGCLQAMWDEGPGEPFSAHGHYINMSNTDYSKVACGFSSSGGGIWSNQNFSP